MTEDNSEGWQKPTSSQKWHYFKKARSLCGKWGWFDMMGKYQQGNDTSPDNCKACKRKLGVL